MHLGGWVGDKLNLPADSCIASPGWAAASTHTQYSTVQYSSTQIIEQQGYIIYHPPYYTTITTVLTGKIVFFTFDNTG
jgi:hypothetical protein